MRLGALALGAGAGATEAEGAALAAGFARGAPAPPTEDFAWRDFANAARVELDQHSITAERRRPSEEQVFGQARDRRLRPVRFVEHFAVGERDVGPPLRAS